MTMTGILSLAIPAGVTGDWLMLLLDASVKGLAILTIAGVVTLLMRKISAAERQLVWVVAMAALLILPVVSAALPGWQVLPSWRQAAPPPTPEPAPQVTASQQPQSPPLIPAVTEPSASGHTSAAPVVHNAASPTIPAAPQEMSAPPAGTIMTWVLAIWAIGVAVCLAPMVLGRVSLWRLRRGAHALTDAWSALLKQTSEQLGVGRRVTLLRSDRCTMPMVWGVFRVRLLLPAEATDWSAQRRQIVLLHELAHVKRWDCLVKIITQLACGAYWFNPLAWLAAKRIGSEGERACDDLVLAAGNRPSDYAEHLVEISSGLQAGRLAVHSSIAMVRPAKLEGRVRAILNPARIRRATRRRAILIAAALAVGIIIPLACIQSEETLEIPPNTPVRYENLAAEKTVTVEGPLADRILHRLNEGPDRAERGVAMSMDTRKYLHIEERTFQVHGSDLILMDDWGVREWVIDDIEATLEALIPQAAAGDHDEAGTTFLAYVGSFEVTMPGRDIPHLEKLPDDVYEDVLRLKESDEALYQRLVCAQLMKYDDFYQRNFRQSHSLISPSEFEAGQHAVDGNNKFFLLRCFMEFSGTKIYPDEDLFPSNTVRDWYEANMPAASVDVLLVDEQGQPAVDIRLRLMGEQTWPATNVLAVGGPTGMEGRYRFTEIPTGLSCWFEVHQVGVSEPFVFENAGSYVVTLKHIPGDSGQTGTLAIVEQVLSKVEIKIESERTTFRTGESITFGITIQNLTPQEIAAPLTYWSASVLLDGEEFTRLPEHIGDWNGPGVILPDGGYFGTGLTLSDYGIGDEVLTIGEHEIAVKIENDVSNVLTITIEEDSYSEVPVPLIEAPERPAGTDTETPMSVPAPTLRPGRMDGWRFVATVGGLDRITHTHLRSLLSARGIDCGLGGSRAYAVTVPEADHSEAIKVIKEDLRQRKYNITLHTGGEDLTFSIPDSDWQTSEPGRLHADLLSDDDFAAATDIGALLRSPEVMADVLAFPYVVRIKSLQREYLDSEQNVRIGHQFEIELAVKADEEIGGKRLRFQVWDQGKQLQHLGSNEWGHGSRSEVDRNKEEYDKRPADGEDVTIDGDDPLALVAELRNSDVVWDGTYVGLQPTIKGDVATRLLGLGDRAAPALRQALASPDKFASAHVLLTKIGGLGYKSSASHWNGLQVTLHADGTVDLHPQQIDTIRAMWQTAPDVTPSAGAPADRPVSRTFNSQLPLSVSVAIAKGYGKSWAVTDTIGVTPSVTPIELPEGRPWFVIPRGRVDMTKLRRELRSQRIPGLWLSRATDDDLAHLKGLKHLQWLDLSHSKITDAGLVHLKALTGLRTLLLPNCEGITDAGIAHLSRLTGLKRLDLRSTNITDAGLAHLQGLTDLKELDISATKITDAGLVHLAGMTHLEWLDVSLTRITDAGAAHLKGLTSLKELDISGTSITDASLAHLAAMPHLAWLDLNATGVGNMGLAYMGNLKSLKWLNLAYTKITDDDLASLKSLKGLEQLFLYDTKITNAGLAHLKGLTSLQKVDLSDTNVTARGAGQLRRALPSANIVWPNPHESLLP
ncbi:hypothetical protein LCGC14_0274960 [marine sediment metagenome]|uniref:Peptidase M56 domain-containing protein n=1 Tax=marine sediment metagenome TaxID=412755 RepID=A0A0F9X322_9ZZZZ|nr:hypothetical protein [Phycisphaerae bacterium]HDZ43365.1 hypothetical protein [Phycisphaerae bacterium]